MQVLREKNMSWFGSLIHPVPNDDSMPLLSTSKKSYRELILANTISVFDLRVYLLSRQSALLSKLRQLSEICWKAFTFLSTFGRHLREVEVRQGTNAFDTICSLHFAAFASPIFYRIVDVLFRSQCSRPVRFMGFVMVRSGCSSPCTLQRKER